MLNTILRSKTSWKIALFLAALFIAAIWFLNRKEAPASVKTTVAAESDQSSTGAVGGSVNEEGVSAWMNAAKSGGKYASIDPADFAKIPTSLKGHPSYVQASFLIQCQEFLQSRHAVEQEIKALVDSSGGNAGLEQAMFMREVEAIRCRNVAAKDYDKIDGLMREAANSGDPGAKSFFANRTLMNDMESSVDRTADGSNPKVEPSAEAKQAAKEVLSLALSGNMLAMMQARQVTRTDRYGLEDPIVSAAWRVVINQPYEAKTFDPSVFDPKKFEDLAEKDVAVVLAKAKNYFDQCCVFQGTSVFDLPAK